LVYKKALDIFTNRMDFIKDLYELGVIPLMFILIYVIAMTTPSNIILDTVEFTNRYGKYFPLLYFVNLIVGIILVIFGFILAILYTVVFDIGNLSGYSLISLGIVIFAFLFTTQQVQGYEKFVNDVMALINLKVDYSKSIKNVREIENQLYLSRAYLFLGLLVCLIGVVLIGFDNPIVPPDGYKYFIQIGMYYVPVPIFQFRYIVMISIGYAFANFGWGKERTALNSIIQNQILDKLKSSR
jgi:hypothetical protein